jgi:AraC-like DNA-binding protein
MELQLEPDGRMKNFCVYFPASSDVNPWQCQTTSCGFARCPPGGSYPPEKHPSDHQFTWSNGRVLNAYQLVYIVSGSGQFESAFTELRPVSGGDLLILFPGVWHRYAPDNRTGWSESWIECHGPAFDRAQRQGAIRPEAPVRHVGWIRELLNAFDQCHEIARMRWPNNQKLLSTVGLHILSILGCHSNLQSRPNSRIEDVVSTAKTIIMQRCASKICMRELATELGVGYSCFRHAFKAVTGTSPKQYQVQLRLRKSRDLLLGSPKSIGEIAAILGFDSQYHFSTQFRRHVGQPPTAYRRR